MVTLGDQRGLCAILPSSTSDVIFIFIDKNRSPRHHAWCVVPLSHRQTSFPTLPCALTRPGSRGRCSGADPKALPVWNPLTLDSRLRVLTTSCHGNHQILWKWQRVVTTQLSSAPLGSPPHSPGRRAHFLFPPTREKPSETPPAPRKTAHLACSGPWPQSPDSMGSA